MTCDLSLNVFHAKDDAFKALRNNKNITILARDKDSTVVIMNKKNYVNKAQDMIDESILSGEYTISVDTIIKDLESFQSFLTRHFKNHPNYEAMRPSFKKPGRFFVTVKTHKAPSFHETTSENLKLRPIIDQTNTCYYNAGKVLAR